MSCLYVNVPAVLINTGQLVRRWRTCYHVSVWGIASISRRSVYDSHVFTFLTITCQAAACEGCSQCSPEPALSSPKSTHSCPWVRIRVSVTVAVRTRVGAKVGVRIIFALGQSWLGDDWSGDEMAENCQCSILFCVILRITKYILVKMNDL